MMALIPEPVSWEKREDGFLLTPATGVFAVSSGKTAARILREALRPATGFELKDVEKGDAGLCILEEEGHGSEGYHLQVGRHGVELRASAEAGWFYAIQTLRQLLPPAIFRSTGTQDTDWTIPGVSITDHPRFGWRGLMLDTARHFFPVEDIKRFLDHMAVHKFNVFHWHLVDDQGWRLEIRRYPRLVEVGSLRAESPRPGNRKEGDGVRYGGHYTQDDVREIVRYAADRHITVVPEIEMPGHSGAALAAYPELGNTDIPDYHPTVRTRWGVNPYIYAPTEAVFIFLENVLTEVLELFPGKYIHIGGDEAPKEQWRQSARAREVMQREGLPDEEAMQAWFIRRIEKFLHSHQRRLIGWDEIAEGGLSQTSTMMLWRDWKWARAALSTGNSVVMSPASHCYLDYSQGPIETEPEAICGELTLEKAYSFEPLPADLEAEAGAGILGIQGNVWTEYIRDREYLDYMTWPRAAALAEVAWSPREKRSWSGFSARMSAHFSRLEELGITFREKSRRELAKPDGPESDRHVK